MPNTKNRPPLHVAFANRIKGMWSNKGLKGCSMIRNPINTFKAFKNKNKRTGSKHAHSLAVAQSVRSRVLNGPELNVVLLGVPFLIDFGISYATGAFDKNKKVKKTSKGGKQPICLKVKHTTRINDEIATMEEAVKTPLPQGPMSNEAQPFYLAMVRAGMSPEGAYLFCTGACENTELSEVLDEEDCQVLVDSFGDLLYPLENQE